MPKHDFTPAKTSEYLESFVEFLERKASKASNRDELERLTSLQRDVHIEYLARLHIDRAWIRVKLEMLKKTNPLKSNIGPTNQQ
jgi:acyl-CoA thioesterase FadM